MFREFVIFKRKAAAEHDREITLIYNREALKRAKRLPSIKKLLSSAARAEELKQQQFHEQQMAMLEISKQFGIKARKVKIVWKDVSEIPKRTKQANG